jgi:hypothetical protein
MKVDYSRFSLGGPHGKHVVATGKGKTGTNPTFALGPRKTKKKYKYKKYSDSNTINQIAKYASY